MKAAENNNDAIYIKKILENMNDGIVVINSDGEIVIYNKAAENILGILQGDVIEKNYGEVFLEYDKNPEFNQILIEVVQKNLTYDHKECFYTSSENSRIRLSINASLLRNSGPSKDKISGYIVVIRDVTKEFELRENEINWQHKINENMHLRVEGLKKFADRVAHEIRNPIVSLGGFARLIDKKEKKSEITRKYIPKIISNAERIEQLIEHVQRYSALKDINMRPELIVEFMTDICDSYKDYYLPENVTLTCTFYIPETTIISIDSSLIRKVIYHMLNNSCEAVEDNGYIEISLHQDKDQVVINIMDTGRGIPAEELPFIFDPFYSSKADYVGMSLAYCKEIVLIHHGDIIPHTHHPHGTEFDILLPINQEKYN